MERLLWARETTKKGEPWWGGQDRLLVLPFREDCEPCEWNGAPWSESIRFDASPFRRLGSGCCFFFEPLL